MAKAEQSLGNLPQMLDSVNRRITILEDRYDMVRKQHQYNEQNFIKGKQDLHKEIQVLDSQLRDLNQNISKLTEQVTTLNEELKNCAKKEDVEVIEKFLDLIEPLNFVTIEEAKRMISEKKSKP